MNHDWLFVLILILIIQWWYVIWPFLPQTSISKDRVVPHVCQAFQQLYDDLHAYSPCFERLGHLQQLAATPSHTDDLEKVIKDTEDRAKLLLKAIGFTSATRPFQEAMLELYSKAFKAFDAATPEPSGESVVMLTHNCPLGDVAIISKV